MPENSPAVDYLCKLGSLDSLRDQAVRTDPDFLATKVNAHVHLPPNFSAFTSVNEVIKQAVEEKIGVLGANQYYDFGVYRQWLDACEDHDIFPLLGMETMCMLEALRDQGWRVNDPDNPGKMYLCGKGIVYFDPMPADAVAIMQRQKQADAQRLQAMTEQASAIARQRGLEINLTSESIIAHLADRFHCEPERITLQERHLAQAIQLSLFEKCDPAQRLTRLEQLLAAPARTTDPQDATSIQNEIRSHLLKAGGPAFVPESYMGFEQARQMILAMGGIPCYPVLIDGVAKRCEFEQSPAVLLEQLQQRGLFAVEFIPSRNTIACLDEFVTAMDAAGLIVTAGTEHNTPDRLPLSLACKDGPLPESLERLFWKGACIVAAHQYLVAQEMHGFVVDEGHLNDDFQSNTERSEWFWMLGAALINRQQAQPSGFATD